MKPKTTIILGALLLVCILFALLTSDALRPSKPADEGKAAESKISTRAGKWTRLTIEGKTGKFVFEKVEKGWRIVEPVRAKAEAWRVDDVADALKDLKGQVAENVDAETTALDKPLWTLTAVDDKSATYKLLVGRPRPLQSGQTYVRPAGEAKVFVASVDFAGKLDKQLSDFRNQTVLEFDKDKVARVDVAGKTGFELVKRDGKWGVVKPVSAPADEEAVKKFLGHLAGLRAGEFVSDAPGDLAPYGLDRPQLIARVELAGETPTSAPATTQPTSAPAAKPKPGKKYALAIGKQIGEKLYARLLDQPSVFKVDKSLLTDLQPKLTDLRVKQVMRLSADEVTAIELALPSGAASLVKTDGQWQMTAPLKGQADPKAVKDLLDDVAALKAESFNDDVAAPAAYGLDKPAATLTFRLAGKGESATLLIGGQSKSGEMRFVKTAAGLAVAVVRDADTKSLLAEPANYWQRSLLKLPSRTKVTALELRRTDATFTLAKDANDAWMLSAPVAGKADGEQVNKAIDRVEALSADKIVALGKDVPDKYAKAKDIMQVIVTTETTAAATTAPSTAPAATQATRPTQPATRPAPKPVVATHQFTVAKVGLHAYAWLAGQKIVAVGQFAPSLYDDLAGELRGKGVWTIEPDDIQLVKIVAGSDSVELKKDGKSWQYTTDKYVKIDAEKVTSYLKDVKDLAATRFTTHAAPPDASKYGLAKPWMTLELVDGKGVKLTLAVSHEGATKTKDRYGLASTVKGVFLLKADAVDKIAKKLKDFKK